MAGTESLAGGDAVLTGGQWSFSSPQKEGMQCPDGSWAPTVETFKFDDVTIDGESHRLPRRRLRPAAGPVVSPFTLSFKEPLPIPVEQYPLYCEPGGLKRCF